MGTTGTSGDLTYAQAEAFLIDCDWIMIPIPELDKQLKIQNMKEWQCGIFQICDHKGSPYESPLPYALLFNNINICVEWICTGEWNKDGIFHTHAMFRTGARSDSLRRTLLTTWNNLMGYQNFRENLGPGSSSMDVLKLQKCHKPESMFGYLMKGPKWVIGTNQATLEICCSIDAWGLNDKWKPKDEPIITDAGEMNKMTEDIVGLITEFSCKTFEDCLRHGPLIMQKYLHRPGLTAVVNNCLAFVRSTGSAWNLSVYAKYRPNPSIVHRTLLFQGIPPVDFDQIFWTWITKTHDKKNTILIRGPSNTGKSAFIAGFKQCVTWGEVVNAPTFAFEGLLDCTIGVWEEPLCGPELAEKAKQVLEGMSTSIPIKHKKPQMLPRTPILITTNHDLWRFCQHEEDMFRNRMWIFNFNHTPLDAPYFPRTSEYRCKCSHCRASRGGSSSPGEPSSPGVQTGEQSIPTEQSSGTESQSEMGSGSMLGAGEGTSGSYSSSPRGSSSSTDKQCSSSGEPSSSSGNTAQQHMGTFRIIRTDSSKHRLPIVAEHVEPNKRRRRSGNDSSTDGNGSDRRGGMGSSRGRTRQDEKEHAKPVNVGSTPPNRATKGGEIKTSYTQSELDNYLESQLEPMLIQMFAPYKQDWQNYLSYLHHRYG